MFLWHTSRRNWEPGKPRGTTPTAGGGSCGTWSLLSWAQCQPVLDACLDACCSCPNVAFVGWVVLYLILVDTLTGVFALGACVLCQISSD
jgi:hypothetical protein